MHKSKAINSATYSGFGLRMFASVLAPSQAACESGLRALCYEPLHKGAIQGRVLA